MDFMLSSVPISITSTFFCLFVMIFCTVSGNGCLLMVLKGFFANINMKPKNPMDSSGVVVELAME